MNRRTKRLQWLVILFSFTLGGASCKKIKESLEVKPLEETIDRSGKLPVNFPKNVPIYPGARLTEAMVFHPAASSGMKDGCLVRLETADPSPKVSEFYRGALPEFEKRNDFAAAVNDEDLVLAFVEKTGRTELWVRARKKGQKTEVELNVRQDGE